MKRLMLIGGAVALIIGGVALAHLRSTNGAADKMVVLKGAILSSKMGCKPIAYPRADKLTTTCEGEITIGPADNPTTVSVSSDTRVYDGKTLQNPTVMSTLQKQATPVKVSQNSYGHATKITY
jgi:hypothetical protein